MARQQHDEAHDSLGPRGQSDVVGHVRIPADAVENDTPINNVIARAKTSSGKWLQDATELIGPARACLATHFNWNRWAGILERPGERYAASASII